MMRKLIKNVSVITKNYRTSSISNINSCEDNVKIKSENEIKKIIFDKREEYLQLMMTQSVKCNVICAIKLINWNLNLEHRMGLVMMKI